MTRSATSPAVTVGDRHHDHDFNFLADGESIPEDAGDEALSVSALQPSARLLYDLLEPQIAASAKVQSRIAAGRKICILARLPHGDWAEALHLAVCEIVAAGARGRVRLLGFSDDAGSHYDTVISSIARSHLALAASGDIVPVEIAMLADIDVDLRRIPFDAIQTVIARETLADPTTMIEPAEFDLTAMRPAFLDGAIACADTAAEAISIAKLATADFRRRQKATEAEAAAKLASTSLRTATIEVVHPVSPTVSDLAGFGAAETWAADLARDIGDYEVGVIQWADVDAGCLLSGPPGTGKTMFASALAASADVPFLSSSFAQWQGSRGGHLGDVVKAMRETFATANAHAPCVLFIDEVDSIPCRGDSREYDDYWRPIVNALLECLDGTSRREGVVVVAACNDASRLDSALTRSGRLDRHFEIGLPDEFALARIVVHHLPDIGSDAAETVATALAGTASGADVARIAREARRVARRDRRAVTASDLLAIAMPACHLSSADRRLVAVHEAGHAVAALALGFEVNSLSIVRRDGIHGGVAVHCGETMVRVAEIESRVVGILSGRAAEEILLGEASGGASGDLEEAAKLVSQLLGRAGLGDRLVPSAPAEVVVEARLRSLYARSLRLITERRPAVEALAELAIEKRVIGRKAIAEFAAAHDLVPTGEAA